MTPEENRRREQDEHVKFIKEHICDRNGDKSFVFISYKSDDWNIVLHDIVYKLVKDYGLNVYFDGSFDSHNKLWIEQFPQNMESYKCKGVLAFLDDKYATSYATLLELMYSQTDRVKVHKDHEIMPVVPINLDKLTKIYGEAGEFDTYLGSEYFEDRTRNVNAEAEKTIFNETFDELKEMNVWKKAQRFYRKGDKLTKKICSEIVAEMVAYLGVNENYYEEGKSLDGIVGSIKDVCGEEVFSRHGIEPSPVIVDTTGDPNKVEGRTGQSNPGGIMPPAPETEEVRKISLPDFLKTYNQEKFTKSTFKKLKLIGKGEYAVYGTGFYDSAYEMVWAFVNAILEQKGEEYIRFVNDRNAGTNNPPFITVEENKRREARGETVKYRQLSAEGLTGYCMCRNFSPYYWISGVLKKRMKELNLPLDQFVLEYELGEASPMKTKEGTEGTDSGTSTGGSGGTKLQKPKEPPKPPKLPQPIGLPPKEPLTKNTTLKEFREFCEYSEFCQELREIRENGKKQYFDYLVAALLRGCDERAFKKANGVEEVSNLARWNYCTYAVSRTLNLDLPVCGASQFTWTSNARKAVGIEGAGTLGASSETFEKLGEDVTLGQIEKYFTDATEAAFSTRDNAMVLKALNAILQIDVKKVLSSIGI